MRIMHLLKHRRESNGQVNVAVDLACEQAAAGHDIAFVSSGGAYGDLLREHGVDVVDVPGDGGLSGTLRVAASVVRLARRRRPDLIHAHMVTSAIVGSGAARAIGCPLVTTVHNSFDRQSVLMRLGTVVVAVSESENRLLVSRGFPARKVVTVLNGAVDSPRQRMAAERVEPIATPCVATLSGLHQRKCVQDVVTAFSTVRADFPKWHLNIIGSGPDRGRLECLVRALELSDRVHFVGFTTAPQPLLEQADIFAHAALAEPFGLAIAEARAAGCAVVATSVGGVPEVLDNGRAGQLVPVSDPSAMASALRDLMSDPTTLQYWQEQARKGVELLSVQRMADNYLRLYESLVAS